MNKKKFLTALLSVIMISFQVQQFVPSVSAKNASESNLSTGAKIALGVGSSVLVISAASIFSVWCYKNYKDNYGSKLYVPINGPWDYFRNDEFDFRYDTLSYNQEA